MRFLPTILFTFFSILAISQNSIPAISILNLANDEAAQVLTINYELNDEDNDPCEVWLKFSSDGGNYFAIAQAPQVSGDVGTGITNSNQLSLAWDYSDLTSEIIHVHIQLYASDNKVVDISDMLSQVDEASLLSFMETIVGERNAISAPEHLADVRSFINETFTNADLQTENHEFVFSSTAMYNVLGRKQGAKEESTTYIIDGHYDGVQGSPAADDNGSAVAGMLEALRILSQYSFEHSIRFIGFDAEELGLIGSNRYIQNGIKPFENIEGVLNFEMIGYYSDEPNTQTLPFGFDMLFPEAAQQVASNQFRGDFITVVGNTPSNSLVQSFVSAAETYVPELNFLSVAVPGDGSIAPDLRRSDHASFWDNNMKAVMLTDGANFRNLNYHTPGDSLGTLNFEFMKNVVKATIATAAELAVPISASYAQQDLSEVLSIEAHNHNLTTSFSVFPNPSDGIISLDIFNESQSFKARVEVYNIRGEQVFRKVMNIPAGKSTSTFDFQDFPTGSYIINLNAGEATTTRSFIIQ